MPRAKTHCAATAGHAGFCHSPASFERKRKTQHDRITALYREGGPALDARKKAIAESVERWRQTDRGKEYVRRQIESGRSAEAGRRYYRRKAEEADNQLEKELLGQWLV